MKAKLGVVTIIVTVVMIGLLGTALARAVEEESGGKGIYSRNGNVFRQAMPGAMDAQDQSRRPDYVPGEILVKFKEEIASTLDRNLSPELELSIQTGISSIDSLNAKYKAKRITPVFKALKQKSLQTGQKAQAIADEIKARFPQRARRAPKDREAPNLLNIYKVELEDKGADILKVCEEYQKDPNVEYAQPNHKMELYALPNDPYYHSRGSWGQDYDDLWGLKKIQCEQAWDIETGSPDVVVAVIDTGVDYNHEDIDDNIWINEDEIPNNGIDDDNNGYVDDVKGWDFAYDDNDPMDGHGHGTHCSGTIAAVGNNARGVVGVTWDSKIMAVKGLSDGGSGAITDLVNCIYYAADNGADILSNSWGGEDISQTLQDTVNYVYNLGCIFVAAAGNSDSDAKYFFPAGLDNVFTVAATDPDDKKASFSNYGSKIEVAAPGVDILSLRANGTDMYGDSSHIVPPGDLEGKYYRASGTSMACPHVAGLAGLILSKNPDWSNEQVGQILTQGVDIPGIDIPDSDKYIGTGRINVYKALQIDSVPDAIAEITSPIDGELIFKDAVDIIGTATGSSYIVEYGEGIYPTEWINIGSGSQVVEDVLVSWDTSKIEYGDFVIRLVVSDIDGKIEDRIFVEVYKYTHEFLDGWPKNMATLEKGYSSPVVGDLDGDGDLELVIGGSSGIIELHEPTVFAWHHDGEDVSGWPKFTDEMEFIVAEGVSGSPAILDLDNDGYLEVIVGAWDGKVYIWNHDGTDFIDSIWPKQTGNSIYSSPAVGDLDGDGIYEIVIASDDGNLYAWHQDGTPLIPGSGGIFYSFGTLEIPPRNTPALADLDNDGDLDIIMTVSQSAFCSKLYAFDYTGSLIIDTEIERYCIKTPVVGDLDNDGNFEVVISCYDKLYVFRNDGELKDGNWPVKPGDDLLFYPFLGDIDNDGNLDIVVTSYGGKVYAIDHQGNYLFSPIQIPAGKYEAFSSSAIGDIDGDEDVEIIIATAGPDTDLSIFAWHHDGTSVSGWPFIERRSEVGISSGTISSPALVDLDMDNNLDIVVAGQNGRVYAIKTKAIYNPLVIEWSMFQHDPQHTGCYTKPGREISVFKESFEQGWGEWSPDDDGHAPEFIIERSSDQAYDGKYSVRIYIDGGWDEGTGWVERPIFLSPNFTYTMDMSFWLWSKDKSDVNQWYVVAYGGINDPETEGDFERIGRTDEIAGWKEYTYTTEVHPDTEGKLYAACGISCVYEVQRSYYIDLITLSFTPLGPNNPPVLDPIGDKVIDEGQLLEFIISGSDSEGDALSFSMENGPEGASLIDSKDNTATFAWTPTYEQAGEYDVTFIVSDGGLKDSETITITVNNVNRAPVFKPIDDKTVKVGALLTFTATATDPDRDHVTKLYAKTGNSEGLPKGAHFRVLPRVALYPNPEIKGIFTWRPSRSQVGTHQVTFIASDGELEGRETVAITVEGRQ